MIFQITSHDPYVYTMNEFRKSNTTENSDSYYKRMINDKNVRVFTESLKKITWDSVITENDPIDCFNNFFKLFSDNYELTFPIKKVTTKKRN